MVNEWTYIVAGSAAGWLLVWKFKMIHLAKLGNSVTASDTEYHLLLVEKIKNNKNNPFFLKDERFVVNSNFNYPYLLHWILSFLKTSSVQAKQSEIQVFIKSFAVLITALFTGFALAFIDTDTPNSYIFMSCVFSSCIFGLSPINRCTYWWAQYDYQLSPRALGILVTILTEVNLLLYSQYDHFIFTILIVILTCMTCLSSRFALQTQFFLISGFCFFYKDFSPLLYFAFGLFLTVVGTNSDYKSILSTHLRHFYIYAKRTSFQHPDAQLHNPFTSDSLLKLYNLFIRGYYREFFQAIQRDVVIRPIAYFPIHITCLILICFNYEYIKEFEFLYICYIFWITMWFSCIITSFKYTKFLGESDRYVEFGAIFPCTILCVLLAFNNQTSLLILSCSILLCTGWYFLLNEYQSQMSFTKDSSEDQLYEFLSKYSSHQLTVACVPIYKARPLANKLNFRVLSYLSQISLKKYDEVIMSYPFVRLEKEILHKYGITHVLVYKTHYNNTYVKEKVTCLNLIYENPVALVYEVPSQAIN